MKKQLSLITFFLGTVAYAMAQQAQVVDKVVAQVGNSIILKSEVDMQYAQFLSEGNSPQPSVKCMILERLLTNKLLSQQAVIDSILVNDDEVDDNINNRLRYMTQRAGGQEQLEQFLNRSLLQYKEEMRDDVKELLVAEKMQRKITERADVTPAEIKRFFERIPEDSLPNYNTEVELGEIVVFPEMTKEEKLPFYNRAESIRMGIKAGDDFGTMARLYSQDRGSAPSGGELGFMSRGDFVKEFSAVAFKLKPGEISNVFETQFGYHFLQVLERRGEQVRARHILISIKPTQASLDRAKAHIDSVYTKVKEGNMTFSTAASLYSDEQQQTKFNGGMMINMEGAVRSTFIPVDQLDAADFAAIDTLKAGEYSRPFEFKYPQMEQVGYRFLFLKSRIPPHKASLEQDYPKIQALAREDKINRVVSDWFEKRRKSTFIRIDQEYASCSELREWDSSNTQLNASNPN